MLNSCEGVQGMGCDSLLSTPGPGSLIFMSSPPQPQDFPKSRWGTLDAALPGLAASSRAQMWLCLAGALYRFCWCSVLPEQEVSVKDSKVWKLSPLGLT
ncbi:hypothetical protein AK812_SmicGene3602 [Symbiodinium microadriaticum]|uniref:Uncharacterized protein n=1 Tax=Symbiodinium microadriaticum TaxID=2951 RepID=A0A1Q9EYL6_SYMMI|nr:hypothetical protein AK812_SmicGene3602 [Symbiodinium microadriaticum]